MKGVKFVDGLMARQTAATLRDAKHRIPQLVNSTRIYSARQERMRSASGESHTHTHTHTHTHMWHNTNNFQTISKSVLYLPPVATILCWFFWDCSAEQAARRQEAQAQAQAAAARARAAQAGGGGGTGAYPSAANRGASQQDEAGGGWRKFFRW